MSRYAPVKSPKKSNVSRSVTWTAPFGVHPRADVRGGKRVLLGERGGRGDERHRSRDRDQNCTRGASRTGSSISKNVRGSKWNIPAMTFVGTVWIELL